MAESGDRVDMDHRVDDKKGDQDGEIFCSGPDQGEDHKRGNRDRFHELDGRRKKLAQEGTVKREAPGEYTGEKGQKESKADAAEGRQDRFPEACISRLYR